MNQRVHLWFQQLCFGMLLLVLQAAGAFGQPCGRPRITSQPASVIVLSGSNAVFTVGVLDEGCAFSYMWRYYGATIQGATDATLVVYDVRPPPAGIAGAISVVITNVGGSAMSSVAYLTVVGGPL